MTGTDEAAAATAAADAVDDDALYVLTAVLLTPAQFPSVLGDDFPEACAALGLEPYPGGYGLVLGQDGSGARWTVIVDDVSLVAVAIASWDCGMEYDLSPDERTVVAALPGWPLELAVAAPGVAPPHDPEPEPDEDGTVRPPLTPPDTSVWGSPQRRLGADEIALQWAMWRGQIADGQDEDGDEEEDEQPEPTASAESSTAAPDDPADESADAAPETSADAADSAAPSTSETPEVPKAPETPETPDEPNPDTSPTPGDLNARVERVLDEVRQYLDSPPPLGRVRSSFAPGGARMLRADGPGWSIVARTDDIAFVLLDDEPGEVTPVGRGPKLPELLEALDAIAVRPS
ncbi:hypothetical protein [Streptomyces melanogenes]|uniref:hypothetical protein n=1 Tax=Streptomyces melanogenes TaxID=67326 RepID=UPI00167EEE2F|nr:hypothetical protein [Streptomyces melanogenes]GGP32213.1 hypothetical protein GCM10010278_02710 [Streptomyces melanogenes]